MAAFSFDKVKKALGTPPVIVGRPNWTSLWDLKSYIIGGLRKLKNPRHPNEGFAPYMRTIDEQALISDIPWEEPTDPGDYFPPTINALTERMVAAEEGEFKHNKALREGFQEIDEQLVQIFENCIEPYRS